MSEADMPPESASGAPPPAALAPALHALLELLGRPADHQVDEELFERDDDPGAGAVAVDGRGVHVALGGLGQDLVGVLHHRQEQHQERQRAQDRDLREDQAQAGRAQQHPQRRLAEGVLEELRQSMPEGRNLLGHRVAPWFCRLTAVADQLDFPASAGADGNGSAPPGRALLQRPLARAVLCTILAPQGALVTPSVLS
jgi:hypothetical protein